MKRRVTGSVAPVDDDGADVRPIRVRVLEKDVQLACRTGDEEALLQAAAYVNTSMRELRQRKPSSSLEKIAVVTAINCAHELLRARASTASSSSPPADGVDVVHSAPAADRDAGPTPPGARAAIDRAPQGDSGRDDPAAITERLKLLNDEVEALLAAQDED